MGASEIRRSVHAEYFVLLIALGYCLGFAILLNSLGLQPVTKYGYGLARLRVAAEPQHRAEPCSDRVGHQLFEADQFF
jgi:hypothetical protein